MAIIDFHDIDALGRPSSADEKLSAACIEEAEQLDIKPAIGTTLLRLLSSESSERINDLLNGCEYTGRDGEAASHKGIRKALAYYAYARLVRAAGAGRLTRYAYVQNDADWSHHSDAADRQAAYEEAFGIADSYMQEIIHFLRSSSAYPEYKGRGVRNNRISIEMIGR